jgi:hypothetical protein
MPSARQIERARLRFATLLPDLALIERPTKVSDGGGGYTQTWATLADMVPCRLAPVGGGEDDRGGAGGGDRISDESTAILTFAAGTDVTESDRVTVAGQRFDVLLVRHRGQYEITRRVEARESA